MNDYEKDTLAKLEIFFNGEIKTPDDIFLTLEKIFGKLQSCIYFVTPENLKCKYSSKNSNFKDVQLSAKQSKRIFNTSTELDLKLFSAKSTVNAERLIIQNTIYGIVLIQSEKLFSEHEKRIFKTCARIISNILKDIELTNVIKMQTQALQKGLIETAKTNEIIKNQNKKIIEADKIKNQFLSHVSHELRTPLNSIIGFSELLQNPKLGKLNIKQTEFVKDIQNAGIHLLGMINEILDISKIESGTMKLNLRNFELANCIEETLNILKPLYEKKNIDIKKDLKNIDITADYQKIQQILFNIINNAIKFSPEKDSITISTNKTKKFVEIKIKDNGCGIAKINHKKIFKKFEQINSTKNSTGLGLTITKELIKMHNGKISLKSELDKGAEFIIKLPVSNEVDYIKNIC